MGWYSTVSRNIGEIPNAIAYFETELEDAKRECKLTGYVELTALHLPLLLQYNTAFVMS